MSTFEWQYPTMDFLFTQKNRNKHVVTTIIRGLPSCRFIVDDPDDMLIRFESTTTIPESVTNKIPQPLSWETIGSPVLRKSKQYYFTHCFLAIPEPYELILYEYGFSILSTSGIDLFTIISKYWNNAAVGSLMHMSGEQLFVPLCDEDKYPGEVIWQNKSDNFKKQYSDIVFPIGQARKELIIED